MKAYSVFDDFNKDAVALLERNGIQVTVLEKGKERPSGKELACLLKEYDIVIISTAQKISEDMFDDINKKTIIATASVGIDHISVPEEKKHLIKVVNAPVSNRISVAEHTFGLILALRKQMIEGRKTAADGKSKKAMRFKPRDLYGSTIGVVGAGGTAGAVLSLAKAFGMKRLSWTRNPDNHKELSEDGVCFVELDNLLETADIISVNIPLNEETKNLLSSEKISRIKNDSVFISVSRSEITDNKALFEKAYNNPCFSIGMDIDSEKLLNMWKTDMDNVLITPHIAGGTVESRIRLFEEISENIIKVVQW